MQNIFLTSHLGFLECLNKLWVILGPKIFNILKLHFIGIPCKQGFYKNSIYDYLNIWKIIIKMIYNMQYIFDIHNCESCYSKRKFSTKWPILAPLLDM